MATKKQGLSIDTNFEQFCENWIDPIENKFFPTSMPGERQEGMPALEMLECTHTWRYPKPWSWWLLWQPPWHSWSLCLLRCGVLDRPKRRVLSTKSWVSKAFWISKGHSAWRSSNGWDEKSSGKRVKYATQENPWKIFLHFCNRLRRRKNMMNRKPVQSKQDSSSY